jgi:hypothetical protein
MKKMKTVQLSIRLVLNLDRLDAMFHPGSPGCSIRLATDIEVGEIVILGKGEIKI